MQRFQAIIEWKEGRWDDSITEKSIEMALEQVLETPFQCHHMQVFEGRPLTRVDCPACDNIKSQAICRKFEQDEITGWCIHWDQDTNICDDSDITKLLGQ